MPLIVSIHTFDGVKPMHTAKRRAFSSAAAALRYSEKMARKSLRRFPAMSQKITRQNWATTAGSFPVRYVRAVVTFCA